MKKFVLILVVIILAVGAYLALTRNNSYNNSNKNTGSTYSSGNSQPSNVSNQTPAATASVDIKNMMFTPSQITIKKGTKVTWTNDDNVAHTVTSDKGNGPNSAQIPGGETYSYTFNQVGSFQYHCSIHAAMHGTVVVYS